MKLGIGFVLSVLILALLGGCDQQVDLTVPQAVMETTEAGSGNAPQGESVWDRMVERCMVITEQYRDLHESAEKMEAESGWSTQVLPQGSIDAMEERLISAGYSVMDTDEQYPDYLAAEEDFRGFWESVQKGVAAEQEVITVLESGDLSYMLFSFEKGTTWLRFMQYSMDTNMEPQYAQYEVLDWALTDRGNFYYRIYPAGNKHYDDYTLIRLTEPDRELWDLNRKYVKPGGYIASNLFLTDWSEQNFGELSFNDVFDYLYYARYAEQYAPDAADAMPEWNGYGIPAAEFESVILSFFDVDIEVLREKAYYNAQSDGYPWRPVNTNDFVFLQYYTCEPEVTACRSNSDGTITLTVEMLSTDLKTDCLFAHEVTVRPAEDGTFEYVGNRVTYRTEYGLPFCEPRLSWGEIT